MLCIVGVFILETLKNRFRNHDLKCGSKIKCVFPNPNRTISRHQFCILLTMILVFSYFSGVYVGSLEEIELEKMI